MLEHRFGTSSEESNVLEYAPRKHERDIYFAQYPTPEKPTKEVAVFRMGDRAIKMADISLGDNVNIILGAE